MLASGLKESSQDDPIEIKTVDPAAAELLIRYIYCGELQLDNQVFAERLLTTRQNCTLVPSDAYKSGQFLKVFTI